MVRIVDFSPSSQAANLAALKERRASLDQAMVDNLKPQEMRSPWQGAAQLAQSAMLGLRQGNIARQEASSRAELARIAAGIDPNTGPTMEQAAQIGAIDTDWGKALMEGALKSRQDVAAREAGYKHDIVMQEDTQAEGRDTLAATQGFTAGENDLNRQVELKKQEIADHTAAGRQDDAQQATRDLAVLNGQIDAEKAKTAAAVDAGKPQETTAKIMDDWRNKKFGEPDTPEAIQLRDQAISAQNKKGVAASPTSELDKKLDAKEADTWGKFMESRDAAGANAQNMAVLGELVKGAPQGPIVGNLLKLPILRNFTTNGAAMNAIINDMVPKMHVSGSGAQSDLEFGGLLKAMPDLANFPEANAVVFGMLDAKQKLNIERGNVIDAYRNGQATVQETRMKLQELSSRSTIDPKLDALLKQASGMSLAERLASTFNVGEEPSLTGAPGGGGDDADKEGDTATGPNGEKVVFKNGQWVPQ